MEAAQSRIKGEKGMEIFKVRTFSDLTSERLEYIKKLFDEGFKKEEIKRKFSWQNFVHYWEFALLLPMNGLWLLIDEIEEDKVFGIIGGTVYPDMLTDNKIAVELCWRTASEVKGKGLGWELFMTFIEWAIKDQGATRIATHRFLSNSVKADERYDKKIKELGFAPLGFEYYLDVKE
jgi:RimJ/RimL family protein N-acetyltransferase